MNRGKRSPERPSKVTKREGDAVSSFAANECGNEFAPMGGGLPSIGSPSNDHSTLSTLLGIRSLLPDHLEQSFFSSFRVIWLAVPHSGAWSIG